MESVETESQESERRPLIESRAPRVLLADDDHDTRAVLAAALRQDGFQVLEARDGGELLELVSASLLGEASPQPDLIVSDVRMPGFSGLGILTGLRASSWKVPFVLVTAYGSDDLFDEAREVGADAIFYKPFDIDDLRTAICNLLPNSTLRRSRVRMRGMF
jgi:CheY-like chemotaxis protein